MAGSIQVVPLGAGQDVGRSCILVSIGGKNVMLDCGMHMGYQDDKRFPDLSYIARSGPLDEYLDCVIISHFHLDHCGALPYMTEMVGFRGPIYMTHPTKAICPVLLRYNAQEVDNNQLSALEDYRKVQVEYKGDTNFFTSTMIKECMKKVVPVNLHETLWVDDTLCIKAYYAGHVLGAAMFEVRAGSESILYTGDFNMTPDRHLGAAQIKPNIVPDLLISESTYATTIRDSKRARERDFLKKVHDCVDKGGKVLIPVFALGRAQELCILLESYWDRMGLKVPIYFSQGLAEKATSYYRLFINWTNEKIKRTFVQRNMFEFKHILPFNMEDVDQPGAMVLFATPGMLHGGQSLRVFKRWAGSEKNMTIMPGYCVAGTVGHKIINGARSLPIDGGKNTLEVKMSVEYMSFSAHADAKGIMQLIRNCQPKHVMFVHGEDQKMAFLKEKVEKEFQLPVFKPANGETISVPTQPLVTLDVPISLLKRTAKEAKLLNNNDAIKKSKLVQSGLKPFHGTVVYKKPEVDNGESGKLVVTSPEEAVTELMGFNPPPPPHILNFKSRKLVQLSKKHAKFDDWLKNDLEKIGIPILKNESGSGFICAGVTIEILPGSKDNLSTTLELSWEFSADNVAQALLKMLNDLK